MFSVHLPDERSLKSVKVLVTADLHIGNRLPMAQIADADTGATDRLVDCEHALDEIVEIAKHQGVSQVWILGDLTDGRTLEAPVTRVLGRFFKALLAEGIGWIVIGGNHDAAARDYVSKALADGIQQGEMDVVCPRGVAVALLDYAPVHVIDQQLAETRARMDCPTILLTHLGFNGAYAGTWAEDGGIDGASFGRFDVVLTGHFHRPQPVPGHPCAQYVGAPYHLDFGDAGEARHVHVMKFGLRDGKAAILKDETFGLTAPPVFEIVDWEDDVSQLSKNLPLGVRPCYARVRVVAPGASTTHDIECAAKRAVKAVSGARGFRLETPSLAKAKSRIEVSENPTIDEILAAYVKSRAADASEGWVQRVVAVGKLLYDKAGAA